MGHILMTFYARAISPALSRSAPNSELLLEFGNPVPVGSEFDALGFPQEFGGASFTRQVVAEEVELLEEVQIVLVDRLKDRGCRSAGRSRSPTSLALRPTGAPSRSTIMVRPSTNV